MGAATAGTNFLTKIGDDDSCICFNFRADRVREITRALCRNSGLNEKGGQRFAGRGRSRCDYRARPCASKNLKYVCMTRYDKNFSLPVVIPPESMANILANVMGGLNMRNLRVAETEKYAHVTYFFNGGVEQPFPGEERVMIQSPKVATYDLKPEMSAAGIAEAVVKATNDGTFDVIIVNFANADMVGHSGKIEPTIKAVETVDGCLGEIEKAVRAKGGAMLITADHGNAEMMIDPVTGGPHTAHTTNPVPFIVMAEDAKQYSLKPNGSLRDISPTILGMLGINEPKEMTGSDLRLTPALESLWTARRRRERAVKISTDATLMTQSRDRHHTMKLLICVRHPFDQWNAPAWFPNGCSRNFRKLNVVQSSRLQARG
jgi:2,3-bisphosphoglycerate-independent phosphoglycerate mutase